MPCHDLARAPVLTPPPAGLHLPQDGALPPRSRSAWLDPPGHPTSPAPTGASRARARYRGPVRGAWGGDCPAHGCITTHALAFHADLRLAAGNAVNAALRGGGHGVEWLCVDDPGRAAGEPVPVDLHLWLAGVLQGPPRPPRGWGADPGGGAFIGSEDAERHPLGLTLRLDPLQPGPCAAEACHRLHWPNRRWTALRARFASGIHSSRDQTLHWMIGARLSLAPARGADVRLYLMPPQPAQRSAAAALPTT